MWCIPTLIKTIWKSISFFFIYSIIKLTVGESQWRWMKEEIWKPPKKNLLILQFEVYFPDQCNKCILSYWIRVSSENIISGIIGLNENYAKCVQIYMDTHTFSNFMENCFQNCIPSRDPINNAPWGHINFFSFFYFMQLELPKAIQVLRGGLFW